LSEVIPVGEPLDFEHMVKTQLRSQASDPAFVAEKMIAMELALNELSQVMKEIAIGCKELDHRISELEAKEASPN
jgi:hypothetical protein